MAKKTKPNIGATITVNIIGGALAGYLGGSGIEDIFTQFSETIPYIKPIASGVGSIFFTTLGIMQYYNTDEHEGSLVFHIVDELDEEQTKVEPKEMLENLAYVFEKVMYGLHNKDLANSLYSSLAKKIQESPLDKLQYKYNNFKDGFFVNTLDVFSSFRYEGRTIDPKSTFDELFNTGNEIYQLILKRSSDSAKAFVDKDFSMLESNDNLSNLVKEEIALAKDLALWVTYLSKRGGIVGSQVRTKLSEFGINNPNYLARDVETIGNNILSLYDY